MADEPKINNDKTYNDYLRKEIAKLGHAIVFHNSKSERTLYSLFKQRETLKAELNQEKNDKT